MEFWEQIDIRERNGIVEVSDHQSENKKCVPSTLGLNVKIYESSDSSRFKAFLQTRNRFQSVLDITVYLRTVLACIGNIRLVVAAFIKVGYEIYQVLFERSSRATPSYLKGVWMSHSRLPGFGNISRKVVRSFKSLRGLQQTQRFWSQHFAETVLEIRLE